MIERTGTERKLSGFARVELSNRTWVHHARTIAVDIAYRKGEVSMDDVRDTIKLLIGYPTVPNAWGTIFNYPLFEFTGKRITSSHPENHARELKIWRLIL